MVHEPVREAHDDNPFLIAAVLLLGLAALVGALWFIFKGAPEPAPDFDSADYCSGFVNGVAYGVWEHGQVEGPFIEIEQAIGVALNDPAAPQCDPTQADATLTDAESWCDGFVSGYVTTGIALGWGDPPDGFHARFTQECLRVDVPHQPIIAGTGVAELGGGGPPPLEN